MCILGIETSCDETGVAIYDKKRGLLANQLHSQINLHSVYGGVIPELASRDHIRKTIPLIETALIQANLQSLNIKGIAYTAGPGLIGSLMVGATIGRALAYAWHIPAVAINHMEGHLLAPMLEQKPPNFPFIALLISGGHTQLISVKGIGQYLLLGETVDDAVGEAFDKIAKMLGLGYPGGPALAHLAQQGIPGSYRFPRPMINKPGLMFSFSGLKTFTANVIRSVSNDLQTRANIARAFEEAVVETLIIKCWRALKITNFNRLVIAGGVSANQVLRNDLKNIMSKKNIEVFYARPEFCTDNGAMIAYTGMIRIKNGSQDDLAIIVRPRWSLEDLSEIKT